MILTGEYLLFFKLFGSGFEESEKLTFIPILDVDHCFLIALFGSLRSRGVFGFSLLLLRFAIGPGLFEEGRRLEMFENLSFLTFFRLDMGF